MLSAANRHWLRIVLASQVAIGAIELLHFVHCDPEHFDCASQQWIFAYFINYPASLPIEGALAALGTDYPLLDQALHFLAYVGVGTLWWLLLGAALRRIAAAAKQMRQRTGP